MEEVVDVYEGDWVLVIGVMGSVGCVVVFVVKVCGVKVYVGVCVL